MAHACRISSQKTLSYREVSQFMGSLNWASGLIPPGHLHLRPLQHFHSLGPTNRFSTPRRSDPVVLATLLRQWQNLSHQESLSDLSRQSSPFSQTPRPRAGSGSGSVSVASDSGHNSKSQTHSGLPKCDSRSLVSAEPAHHDRVESPPRSYESDIRTVENSSSGQVCHSPQHTSSPVHGSSSGEPRALAIDALSQDWQGRSMYMFPEFLLLNKVIQKLRTTQTGEVILIAPWWPSQPWFPHLLRLSVDHLL